MSAVHPIDLQGSKLVSNPQYLLPITLVVFACILTFFYGPSGHDDSYITYSTALQFAESGKILNTNGERVEQGSSLLHVLLLGGVTRITGLEPSLLGQSFSVFFAVLSLLLMPGLCRELGINQVLALPMLILSVSFSYWAVGGLEATLYTVTILLLFFSVSRLLTNTGRCFSTINDWRLWLSTGLCLLSRPEALFFLFATAIGFAILSFRERNASWGFVLGWLIMIVVLTAALFVFRLVYFDALFPQPVYAKSAGLNVEKIAFGLIYFAWSAQLSIIIFSLFAIVAGIRLFFGKLSLPLKIQFALSLVLAYMAFIVSSGGDWMHGGRFFTPIIPFEIGLFLFFTQQLSKQRWINAAIIALMMLETVIFSLKLASGIPWFGESSVQPAINEITLNHYSYAEQHNMINRRDIPLIDALKSAVDKRLAENPDKVVNIISIQMGMPPYHLRKTYGDKVYFIDLRGLTTKHVTECEAFDEIPGNWFGVAVLYHDYFKAQDRCDLPKPDIVYDLLNRTPEINKKRKQAIMANGYKIVYEQKGQVTGFSGLKAISNNAFIAVRAVEKSIERKL